MSEQFGKNVADAKSTHEKWMEMQGIPIIEDFSIPSLKEVEVGEWDRLGSGAKGAYILLDGAEDSNDAYVLEIAPKKSVEPERHLYEEIIYVLSGRGATSVWYDEDKKRTFEWHEGSLFAIPPNTWHRHFNGSSQDACRFYVVSSAPITMNLFHNMDFIFNNDFRFADRYDETKNFFSGEGNTLPARVWETNFVEDVRTFPLLEWEERGAGGLNRRFEMSQGTMMAHVSRFPVGTYKKGHRHGPGAHVIIVEGQGYSLLWEDGKKDEMQRVDWKEGSVLVPPFMWFHQHFNSGAEPGKYLAIRWGSQRYPLLKAWQSSGKVDVSVKDGGNQIEYEDEDPAIRELFEQELAKNGVKSQMPSVKRNLG